MLGARLRFIPRQILLDRHEARALIGPTSDDVGPPWHLGQKPHQHQRRRSQQPPPQQHWLFQIKIIVCNLLPLHHALAPGFGQHEQPLDSSTELREQYGPQAGRTAPVMLCTCRPRPPDGLERQTGIALNCIDRARSRGHERGWWMRYLQQQLDALLRSRAHHRRRTPPPTPSPRRFGSRKGAGVHPVPRFEAALPFCQSPVHLPAPRFGSVEPARPSRRLCPLQRRSPCCPSWSWKAWRPGAAWGPETALDLDVRLGLPGYKETRSWLPFSWHVPFSRFIYP